MLSHYIVFQQFDCDYTTMDKPFPGMPGSAVGPVPVVRMYGVTDNGHSVHCLVHGFAPYFYALAPPNFQPHECAAFMKALDVRFMRICSRKSTHSVYRTN